MKKMFFLYLFAGIFISVLFSCKHEVDVPMNPAISFTNEIKPIIITNCTQGGCHGSQNFVRIQLLNYDDVIKLSDNSNPAKTKLYRSITGKGADRMPPVSYSPLSDLAIKRILLWMRQGAKNN